MASSLLLQDLLPSDMPQPQHQPQSSHSHALLVLARALHNDSCFLHRLQPISLISMPSTLEHSNTAKTFLFQKISASLCHLQSAVPLLCLPGELLFLPNKLVPVSPPGWSTDLPGVRAPSPDHVGLHLAYSILKLFTLYHITPARGT